MKMLLIIDVNFGQVCVYMVKILFGVVVYKVNLEIIDNLNDVELVIVLGEFLLYDNVLNGKKVWLGDIGCVVVYLELFLSEVKSYVIFYSVFVVVVFVVSGGLKCVVVVMVCLIGVVYIFMVVEVIEIEVKKCGWWVKVEMCGFVGVGNVIILEEVVEVDLVIVVVDIEVDLVKFVGFLMYCMLIGLVLKKMVQELDKVVVEVMLY